MRLTEQRECCRGGKECKPCDESCRECLIQRMESFMRTFRLDELDAFARGDRAINGTTLENDLRCDANREFRRATEALKSWIRNELGGQRADENPKCPNTTKTTWCQAQTALDIRIAEEQTALVARLVELDQAVSAGSEEPSCTVITTDVLKGEWGASISGLWRSNIQVPIMKDGRMLVPRPHEQYPNLAKRMEARLRAELSSQLLGRRFEGGEAFKQAWREIFDRFLAKFREQVRQAALEGGLSAEERERFNAIREQVPRNPKGEEPNAYPSCARLRKMEAFLIEIRERVPVGRRDAYVALWEDLQSLITITQENEICLNDDFGGVLMTRGKMAEWTRRLENQAASIRDRYQGFFEAYPNLERGLDGAVKAALGKLQTWVGERVSKDQLGTLVRSLSALDDDYGKLADQYERFRSTAAAKVDEITDPPLDERCQKARQTVTEIEDMIRDLDDRLVGEPTKKWVRKAEIQVDKWCRDVSQVSERCEDFRQRMREALEAFKSDGDCQKARDRRKRIEKEMGDLDCPEVGKLSEELGQLLQEQCQSQQESVGLAEQVSRLPGDLYEVPADDPCGRLGRVAQETRREIEDDQIETCEEARIAENEVDAALGELRRIVEDRNCRGCNIPFSDPDTEACEDLLDPLKEPMRTTSEVLEILDQIQESECQEG